MQTLVRLLALVILSVSGAATAADSLTPCPPSPNCVSSQAEGDHHVPPLPGRGSPQASLAALEEVLDELPRVTWRRTSPMGLQAEFTSRLFRFVDDLEVLAREDGTLDVRSASRVGYWDLGANRRRVEMLRERLASGNEAP